MLPPVSIRTRLTLLYSGLLFASLALVAAGTLWLLRDRLTTRVQESLAKRIQGVEDFLRRETTEQLAHMIPLEIEEYAFTQPEGHFIEVHDETGRVLVRGDRPPDPSLIRYADFVLYGKRYFVRAAASLAPMEESLRELRWLLLAMTPVLMLLTAILGYWIGGRALAPVDEMTRAARSIGLADLSRRLPLPPPSDEIRRLAEAWNEMLARLEDSVGRIQRFTADAAHELRTPLTVLRTTAELAVRKERAPGEYRDALEEVIAVTERMAGLVDELLTLTHGDSGVLTSSFIPLDLAEIAGDVCRQLLPQFALKGVKLERDFAAGVECVSGDPKSLGRLVTSLVENALQYTPAGGRVRVAVGREGADQVLEVTDTGCGIPGESLDRIFDRFYRVDSSRDRSSGGYGLGLAIAQQIAMWHAARIEVCSTPGQGSQFRLRLRGNAGDSLDRNAIYAAD